MRPALLAACLIAAPLAVMAQSLPDPRLTPGAVDASVRQDNIGSTICAFGWSRAHRPPEAETSQLKRELMRAYGLSGIRLRDVELEHLVPLALAGAPEDVRNLWPELRWPADGWSADMKDELEAVLARDVCICLDRFTFGTFMRVAKDQNIDVRYMLSRALASTLGDVVFDKQPDGDSPATYQRAMLFSSALDLLRSLKEMVAAFEDVPGEAAQAALEKARQVIALAEPAEGGLSLLN